MLRRNLGNIVVLAIVVAAIGACFAYGIHNRAVDTPIAVYVHQHQPVAVHGCQAEDDCTVDYRDGLLIVRKVDH